MDAFNQRAFVAHLISETNGILVGVQHGILIWCIWHRLCDIDKNVNSALDLVASLEGFIARNGYCVVLHVTSWSSLSD